MPLLIALVILVITVFTLVGNIPDLTKISPYSASIFQTQQQAQKSVSQNKPKPIIESQKKEPVKGPVVLVDTFIKYGPLEGEIFDDTNRVIFEFKAKISPEETEGRVLFETKIEGFDEDWKKTYSNERTINLPPGAKEYTFLVRARIKDFVDLSPAKRNFEINISPYFEKLKISGVKLPTLSSPSLITLSTRLSREEKIKITGWELEGEKGSFIIPQGVEKYDSLNPLFSEDILVKRGDRIYISSNPSPFWRRNSNFRPNKCMGYLASSHNFTISISRNCPRPRRDRLPRYLEQNCQDYINSRKSCESLKYERLKNWEIFEDSSCMSYITSNFNYPGCFVNYSQDQNFLENRWHIYMNRSDKEIMDKKIDTIYLRDQNGLLIDKYSYGKK